MVKIDDGKSALFHYKRPNKGRGNLLLSYLSIFHSVILILAHMACKSFHIASWSLRAQCGLMENAFHALDVGCRCTDNASSCFSSNTAATAAEHLGLPSASRGD